MLLQHCLAAGNYLNGQSQRGGAWGFKIEQLDKIMDMKANDNKTTLLSVIV